MHRYRMEGILFHSFSVPNLLALVENYLRTESIKDDDIWDITFTNKFGGSVEGYDMMVYVRRLEYNGS